MDAPTSDLELRRLRTELAEKQLADFKAVVEADRCRDGAPRARSLGTSRGNGGGGLMMARASDLRTFTVARLSWRAFY